MTSKRRFLGSLALVACLGAAVGCSDDTPGTGPSRAPAATTAEHEGTGADESGHATHDHGHHEPAELRAVLLQPADLPAGYREGHAHATPDPGQAPPLAAACAPLAELVGVHPRVMQHAHPEARTILSRSHFGPTVGETIIDFGEPEAAERAVDRLDRSRRECRTYIQSTAASGAQCYRLAAAPELAGHPGASTVRLVALGSDFDIRWDIAWVQYGAQVVAVDLRSAPGGDSADLATGMTAALRRVEAADR